MGKFPWIKRSGIGVSDGRRDGFVKHSAADTMVDLGNVGKSSKETNQPAPALIHSSSRKSRGDGDGDGDGGHLAGNRVEATESGNVGSKEATKAASALIHSHIDSSRTETPWDQEFSSMSSCRSDADGSLVKRAKPLMPPGGEDEDEDELPPLLRNPHIAEFDIVDGFSSSGEFSPGVLRRTGQAAGEEDESLGSSSRPEAGGMSSTTRKRRSQTNSFSASLPSEIKGVVADSIPLVKYSRNPYDDFRLSMLEMIQEKRLYIWGDLEELLFCYLSLNSPEHHDVIKQSFADVWKELGLALPED